MSPTELERAAGRLVGEPTLAAPPLERITERVDQRRRRRRGAFGGAVAALALVGVGALALRPDTPVPVVATGGDHATDAEASTEPSGGDVDDDAHDDLSGDHHGSDKEGGLHWFGGPVDLSVRSEPFSQEVADELAASADQTIALPDATAYVTRDGDRVMIGVVSAERILQIEAPASLFPDSSELDELIEKFGGVEGGLRFFHDGGELPLWMFDGETKFPFEQLPLEELPEELRKFMEDRELGELWGEEWKLFGEFELPPLDAPPEELEKWLEDRFGEFKLRFDDHARDETPTTST